MLENGFDVSKPVRVAKVDGQLIILDGHHRALAASRAQLKSVPIELVEVSPERGAQLLREVVDATIGR